MSFEHLNAELANISEQVRDLVREKRSDHLEEKVGMLQEAILKVLGLVEEVSSELGDLETRVRRLEFLRSTGCDG